MKVALVAIVRNEFPYLLEWVAHHNNIGVDKIIIANLESTDNTNELVEAMEKAGIINTFFVPWNGWVETSPLIKQAVEEYAQDCEWFSFMDADEFFVPDENTSLKQILSEQGENIGGIAFNWAVYGSSFQKYLDNFELPSPVTARFTWRAKKEFEGNNHTKCFVNPKAVALDSFFVADAHALSLKENYHYVNSFSNTVFNGKDLFLR